MSTNIPHTDLLIVMTMLTTVSFGLLRLVTAGLAQIVQMADYDAFDNASIQTQRRLYNAEVNARLFSRTEQDDKFPHV